MMRNICYKVLATMAVIAAILKTVTAYAADSDFDRPDFAYPKTIAKKSLAQLDAASKNGNGQLLVRALINYALAQNAINTDSLNVVLNQASHLASKETNPATASMTNLLLAQTYSQLYKANKWNYDRRELPDEPLSQDYRLWSGQQFRNKITSLIDKATNPADELSKTPLESFKGVIEIPASAKDSYPTLFDFVMLRSVLILQDISTERREIPATFLNTADEFIKSDFKFQPEITRRTLTLLANWIAANKPHSAPYVAADIARLEFVCNHLSYSIGKRDLTQYDAFMQLYNENKDLKASGNALLKACDFVDYNDTGICAILLPEVKNYIRTYSSSSQARCLKNIYNHIIQPRISVSYPQTVSPGSKLQVTVENFNSADYRLRIYKIDADIRNSGYYKHKKGQKTPVLVRTVNGTPRNSKIPFSYTDTINIPMNHAGWYIIVPVTSASEASDFANNSYPVTYCTNLMTMSAAYAPTQWAMVVNPQSGEPQKDILIEQKTEKGVFLKEYTTDIDGSAKITNPVRSVLFAKDNSGTYAAPQYIYQQHTPSKGTQHIIYSFTDLAVYHPGDTVQWCAVVEGYNAQKRTTVSNSKLTAVLFDANYQAVDTAETYTDKFGRAEGRFAIPRSGLTGNFNIQIKADIPNVKDNKYGNVSFVVSDYKLPTFRIDSLKARLDTPVNGSVQVSGKVATYSGFPLSDCRIKASLGVSNMPERIWWHTSPQTFYTTEVSTGNDGSFIIDLPKELLSQAPVANGLFTLQATATSASGETQWASVKFTLGKPCIIDAAFDKNINISSGQMPVMVKLTDYNGEEKAGIINLSIKNSNGKTVLQESFNAGKPRNIDVKSIKSGVYAIKIEPADSTLANPLEIKDQVLYRNSDTQCPVTGTPLWVPQTNIKLKNGVRTANILLGTGAENGYVHYAIASDSTLIRQGWIKADNTLTHLPVSLPEDVNKITVKLWAVYNYNFNDASINIETTPQPGLEMHIESFRNHIIPGETETWTFRVTDSSGKSREAAIMLDMYNRALDQLQQHTFKFWPAAYNGTSYTYSGENYIGIIHNMATKNFRHTNCPSIQLPQLQTWGRSLASRHAEVYKTLRLSAASVLDGGTGGINVVREHKEEAAMNNSVLEEETVTAGNPEGGNTMTDNDFKYRQAEMPLAFFRPMLTTGTDGSLSFSFTAPNANTTWRLCVQAFTTDMLYANQQHDIISAKPVMVQPNLPRFLRTGDKADIKTLVMNNSSITGEVITDIEVFNPLTGKIIFRKSVTNIISAMKSETVNITVNTPFDIPAIGYRVRSTLGTYTDGEQSIIPILESAQPVVETTPFYIPANEQTFSLQLPDYAPEARVTLQFCQNPVWYVVTALPGLRSSSANDAVSAGAALFSAAVAQGITTTNPEISEALKYWTESDKSDSTLVSMLQRNSDLKTVLLECTPWMSDAQSDTERMARLALLFDKDNIDRAIESSIDKLDKLSCAGGGWRWIEQSDKPSEWATENLLFVLGRLNRLGFLPADKRLDKMTREAVSYIDAQKTEILEKNPEATDMPFTYLRQIYYQSIPMNSKLKAMTARTVKDLSASWKNGTAPYKAVSAILLNHNGYKQQALNAMQSIGQYAVTDPAKGMWWPSVETSAMWWLPDNVARTCIILEAYALLEPSSDNIDKIRQWIVLQKEARNWGTSTATTGIIYTMLSTGSDWTRPQTPAIIKIGRKKIDNTSADSHTGYIRTDISKLSPSGKKLTIEKDSNTPSWGAVYSQYTAQMQNIKPVSCTDLSIEKTIYKRIDTPEGTKWAKADSLTVGDIIQVNLEINAGRDIDYVAIIDNRAACLEPVDQLPKPIWAEGICFYRENLDASTNMFVTHMPKGIYRISYQLTVNNAGSFASGIASAQSQYAPALSAHSAGGTITSKPAN